MDDEQFKQKLREVYYRDLARQAILDKLVRDVRAKGLTDTLKRRYSKANPNPNSKFLTGHYARATDDNEPQRIRDLALVLEEFSKSISPEIGESCCDEQQALLDDTVDQVVLNHFEEIEDRFETTGFGSAGEHWKKAQPSNRIFLEAGNSSKAILKAIDDWSSASGVPSSLQSLSQKVFIRGLRQSLEGAKAAAAFCCGDSVAFRDGNLERHGTNFFEAPPVRLQWNHHETNNGGVVFSETSSLAPEFQKTVRRLYHASNLACFGRDGQTVFNETYRRAMELNATEFITNFHPYDCGILKELENILLPSFLGDTFKAGDQRVFAELYKLNVYSGPGGFFKPHKDTPRSPRQFASLVVCLPSAHEGGALVVRHGGRSFVYDWSGAAPDTIQWAAFYSDCEHEVLPLVSGHRITLTYNLYYHATTPLAGQCLALPVHSFPLYHDLQTALQNPGFMNEGGILGFYCSHAYPHSNDKLRKDLPMALKGIDLLIYVVCRSLGLGTKARPILNREPDEENAHWTIERNYGSADEDCFGPDFELDRHIKARKRLLDFPRHGIHIPRYSRKHMIDGRRFQGPLPDDPNADTILPQYRNPSGNAASHPLAERKMTLQFRKLHRQVQASQDCHAPEGLAKYLNHLKSNLEVEGLTRPHKAKPDRIGNDFHEVDTLGESDDDEV